MSVTTSLHVGKKIADRRHREQISCEVNLFKEHAIQRRQEMKDEIELMRHTKVGSKEVQEDMRSTDIRDDLRI